MSGKMGMEIVEHEFITVDTAKSISGQRALNRRRFMMGLGLVGASTGLLVGCSGNDTGSSVMAAGPSELDVLNFALNLEYLEATFYSFATQGIDLPSSVTMGSGTITGAPAAKIEFANQQTTDIFNEIFFNELSHVQELQGLIGSGHVARPALNLSAAGAVSSANVLTISRQFEDVGTTAYVGATAMLTGANLAHATQTLAVEGFQAGTLRLLAIQQSAAFAAADSMDVPTFDPGASVLATQGPTAAGGFFATTGIATATATLPQALAYVRSASQVLQIVYGAAGQSGVSKGGFFPSGLNGIIRTT